MISVCTVALGRYIIVLLVYAEDCRRHPRPVEAYGIGGQRSPLGVYVRVLPISEIEIAYITTERKLTKCMVSRFLDRRVSGTFTQLSD